MTGKQFAFWSSLLTATFIAGMVAIFVFAPPEEETKPQTFPFAITVWYHIDEQDEFMSRTVELFGVTCEEMFYEFGYPETPQDIISDHSTDDEYFRAWCIIDFPIDTDWEPE